MFNEQAQSQDFVGAAIASIKGTDEKASAKGYFTFQCFDKDGKLKWEDVAPNLVVNVGLGYERAVFQRLCLHRRLVYWFVGFRRY